MDGGDVRADPADVHDLRAGVVPGAGVVLRPTGFGLDDLGHAEEAPGACTSGSTPAKARRTLSRIRRGPRTCPCSGRPGSRWVVGTGWLGKPGPEASAEADPAEDAVASR
jgi:hypothetical protein